MPQVLRERELNDLLHVAHGTGPDTIVVTGSPGSGRSALLSAADKRSCVPSALVRANPSERSWKYSGLSAFLAAIDAALGTDLRSLACPPDDELSPFHVAEALDGSLRIRRFDPVVIIVDDADLLDPSSLEVIGFVLRRRSVRNLRAILSVRSVTESGPLSGFPRISLTGLGLESLVELGRSSTSTLAWGGVLETVARSSAGNPQSFESMLAEVRPGVLYENEAMSLPLTPGRALRTNLEGKFTRCSEDMIAALKIISCGWSVPIPVVEKSAGVGSATIDSLFREGFVHYVRDDVGISDPRIRSVVYHSMPESERRSLHADLAERLGDDTARMRAWHLSFRHADGAVGADLVAAAVEFVRSGEILCGVEFAERALALSAADRCDRLFEDLTEALILQCQYTLARRYLRFLQGSLGTDQVSPTVLRLRIVVDFAELSLVNEQHVAKVVEQHTEEDPDECARLLATTGFFCLQQWDIAGAKKCTEMITRLLGPGAEFVRTVNTVVSLFETSLGGRALPPMTELEAARELIQRSFAVEFSWIVIAQVLTLADRFDDARPLLANLTDQTSHLVPLWAKFARVTAMLNENRAGNYHQVRRWDRLISASIEQNDGVSVNDRLRNATLALIDGRLDEASKAIETVRSLASERPGPLVTCQLATIQARIAIQEGDFPTANRHYARCHGLSSPLPSPHALRYLDDYIESLYYSGDVAAAERGLAELEEAQRRVPTAWTEAALARIRALLMTGEAALEEFSRLIDSWGPPELEYQRARTCHSFAHKLKELGYDADAEEMRDIGRSIFAEIGIGTHGAVCGSHTEPAKTIMGSLDEKEVPVVELLMQGHKNHVIAHELFVSVRTVELRLTNIYRKVGVKSRFELMKLLERENSTRLESA